MSQIKITLTIGIREDDMEEHGLTKKELLEYIQVGDDDVCDGCFVMAVPPGCDPTHDFFLSGAELISTELVED